jgi:hypothetical protein
MEKMFGGNPKKVADEMNRFFKAQAMEEPAAPKVEA